MKSYILLKLIKLIRIQLDYKKVVDFSHKSTNLLVTLKLSFSFTEFSKINLVLILNSKGQRLAKTTLIKRKKQKNLSYHTQEKLENSNGKIETRLELIRTKHIPCPEQTHTAFDGEILQIRRIYNSINDDRKIGYLRKNIKVDSDLTSDTEITCMYFKRLNIKIKIFKYIKYIK